MGSKRTMHYRRGGVIALLCLVAMLLLWQLNTSRISILQEDTSSVEWTSRVLANQSDDSVISTGLPTSSVSNTRETTPLAKEVDSEKPLFDGNVCEFLQRAGAPMKIWSDNIERILQSSKIRGDRRFRLRDKTAYILKLISPRLGLSTKSLTRDWTTVERIMTKLQARLEFLQNAKDPEWKRLHPHEPPFIEIVVLGGSVTYGINCHTGVNRVNVGACAWVTRLSQFLNILAGGQAVRVSAIAVGGTNSATGQAILANDMLPVSDPDILINSYSTNDMHILTVNEARDQNLTLHEAVFNMAQGFARTALQLSDTCHRPLLIWIDDYLGNEQRQILATMAYAQSIYTLSSYYGFAFLSYADMMRDIVYGDTREALFSPAGWHKSNLPKTDRDIHPPVGMHVTTAWMIAYNLLNIASSFCILQPWGVVDKSPLVHEDTQWHFNRTQSIDRGLDTLSSDNRRNDYGVLPKVPPKGLPPPLTDTLDLGEVSSLWRNASANLASRIQCKSYNDNVTSNKPRCAISFISGITTNKVDPSKASIENYFKPFVIETGGWEIAVERGNNKLGWSSATVGSTFITEFNSSDARGPLHTVTIFYMKSYGEKWANSTATTNLTATTDDIDWHPVGSVVLYGYHEKMTSEVYQEVIELDPAVHRLRIEFTLIEGHTFKVMGLVVCS